MRHAAGPSALIVLLARAALACAALAPAIPSAAAQTAKPAAPAGQAPAAQPPVGSDPSVTTASYGDWTARCEKGTGEKAQRICEAVQTVQLPNQGAAVAQVAFGHAASADPLKLVVVLPTNVWFPSTVRVAASDKDPGIELAWRRCLPVGCFAESAGTEDAARRLRGEAGQGRILYKDGLNRDVALPVSFRGLAQALDALAKM